MSDDDKRFEAETTIANERGLHARAATKLVQLAAKFDCDVTLAKGKQTANGKSIMGVLTLVATKGTPIKLVTAGSQAEECGQALLALIVNRFGEES